MQIWPLEKVVNPDVGVVFNNFQTSYHINEVKLVENGEFLCAIMTSGESFLKERPPLWYGITPEGRFSSVYEFSPSMVPVYLGECDNIGQYGHIYYNKYH